MVKQRILIEINYDNFEAINNKHGDQISTQSIYLYIFHKYFISFNLFVF